ncbi:DUF2188 domain-containing protein [Frankia sp. AgPm24]|uniref:DUF2188 domain-containing protein n=1 Tax=Frankia sp. AgPm24 TaxID=631128 RepID=UPI00200BDBB7|nr:DUF2188 domain-containing protein [Frankia sp. AgPm24]MCK9923480.1 DUF2188 domain-containing protein [Frankia sp. AgPm24]
MANHKVYRVVPKGGWWQIRHEESFISTHRVKDEGVSIAQKLAIKNQPSQLLLQRADGTTETEWTYDEDQLAPKV